MKRTSLLTALLMAATGAMAQPPPPPPPGSGAPFDLIAGALLIVSIAYATYVIWKQPKKA